MRKENRRMELVTIWRKRKAAEVSFDGVIDQQRKASRLELTSYLYDDALLLSTKNGVL